MTKHSKHVSTQEVMRLLAAMDRYESPTRHSNAVVRCRREAAVAGVG